MADDKGQRQLDQRDPSLLRQLRQLLHDLQLALVLGQRQVVAARQPLRAV